MSAGGERLTAIAGPGAGVLPFQDLDWDLALNLADKLSRFPGGQGRIFFLDAGLLIRCLVDPSQRAELADHLVLPSGGFFSGLLFRAMGARKRVRRFSPSAFIPALMTHAERPMRVVVDDADPGFAASLSKRLAQHAPWHSVATRSENGAQPCDLLIVRGDGRSTAGRSLPPANLTLFAGPAFLGHSD
jgi:UDP-N-acetyl-D-mannosaminuronic acid transferase (WecB/TagA/CpsF family)